MTRYFVIAAAVRSGGPTDLLDHVERKHGAVRGAKLFDAPAKDCVYGVIEYEPHPPAPEEP